MIIDISKLSKSELEESMMAMKKSKKGNLRSFFGKVKIKIDALKLQKQLRNEWE